MCKLSPADSTNSRILLLFSLSLSPLPGEQGEIAKAGGRKQHRAQHADGGAFRCRTCGQEFKTFQALGGHRTSHNRPRVRANGLELLLGARPGKGAAATDVCRCNTCGMVFTTGQALGGHMRRHRAAFEVPVLETMPMTVAVTRSSEEDHDDAGHVSSTLIQFISVIEC
ncbi:unnamed protein product [Urochloa decumbens]|uniref:C2H2-type domain-containing protein n=1 Tax=Urochloa decumbens TaxID=240449 RepID=A0ABC9H6D8_9POAL